MTGRILQILLILSSCLVFIGFAGAEEDKNIDRLTVVYSGNIEGELRPTMICGPKLSGGFPRLATKLNELRDSGKDVLLVDSGRLFAPQDSRNPKMKADLSLKIYNELGLDALNLGEREFHFGQNYLKEASAGLNYPLISSNIAVENGSSWLQKYAVKERGGLKIGILGVLPENAFDFIDAEAVEGLEVISPESALPGLLAELEGKTDLIVLLSRFGEERTTALMKTFPAINLAISSSDKMICEEPIDRDKMVVPSGLKGHYFLSVDIEKGDDHGLYIRQNQPLSLDKGVDTDEKIAGIISEAKKKKMEEIREQRRKMRELQGRKSSSVPALTPEEFRRRIAEQQKMLDKKKETEQQGEQQPGEEEKTEQEEPRGEKLEGAVLKYNGEEVPADIRIIRKNKEENNK